MYRPGSAEAGIAYGAAICEQFLTNGDWAFDNTAGKWSYDTGPTSDVQDVREALIASYNTWITIKDLRNMSGQDILDIYTYNNNYATQVAQAAAHLATESLNYNTDIQKSKSDDDVRAAKATGGKQSIYNYYIQSKIGCKTCHTFYDENNDDSPWIFYDADWHEKDHDRGYDGTFVPAGSDIDTKKKMAPTKVK